MFESVKMGLSIMALNTIQRVVTRFFPDMVIVPDGMTSYMAMHQAYLAVDPDAASDAVRNACAVILCADVHSLDAQGAVLNVEDLMVGDINVGLWRVMVADVARLHGTLPKMLPQLTAGSKVMVGSDSFDVDADVAAPEPVRHLH